MMYFPQNLLSLYWKQGGLAPFGGPAPTPGGDNIGRRVGKVDPMMGAQSMPNAFARPQAMFGQQGRRKPRPGQLGGGGGAI